MATTVRSLFGGPLSTRAACTNYNALTTIQQEEEKKLVKQQNAARKAASVAAKPKPPPPPPDPKLEKKQKLKEALDDFDDLNTDGPPKPKPKKPPVASPPPHADAKPLQKQQQPHGKQSAPAQHAHGQPRRAPAPQSGGTGGNAQSQQRTSAPMRSVGSTPAGIPASRGSGPGRPDSSHAHAQQGKPPQPRPAGAQQQGFKQQPPPPGQQRPQHQQQPLRAGGSMHAPAGAGPAGAMRAQHQQQPLQQRPGTMRPPPQQHPQQRPGGVKAKRRSYEDDEDEYDDDFVVDDGGADDWRRELRAMTGYDPRRFRDADYDDRAMEASWRDIEVEEKRSARLARAEDDAEEERERKHYEAKLRMKKKSRLE